MPDVVVLFFLLGLLASAAKSDLALPAPFLEAIAIYLLLSIGLRGGAELAHVAGAALLPQIATCLAIGFITPLILAPVLGALGLGAADRAAVAAHYGSVSVVTFAVGVAWFNARGATVEAHAPLWAALMEIPGLVTGIALARAGEGWRRVAWGPLAREVLLGRSVLLLGGGLAIGAAAGKAGMAPIEPVFTAAFKGVLAFYLLELGLLAGSRLGDWRRRWQLVPFAVLAPLVLGAIGAAAGTALGLSIGGAATLATLAASASYIAAPTAMRIAVPQADASLSIGLVLGVTFPFNIVFGIPIYLAMARSLAEIAGR
jgi:hypothetical protein